MTLSLESDLAWIKREIEWLRADAENEQENPTSATKERLLRNGGMLTAYLIVYEMLTGERA